MYFLLIYIGFNYVLLRTLTTIIFTGTYNTNVFRPIEAR